jgi:hypothetical protein
MRSLAAVALALTLASGTALAQAPLGNIGRNAEGGLLATGGPPSLRSAVDGARERMQPTPLESSIGDNAGSSGSGSALPGCYRGSFECGARDQLPPLGVLSNPAQPSLGR